MNPYDLDYDLDYDANSDKYYGGVKSSSTKTKTSSKSKGLESITQPNNNYQEIVENIFKDYDLSDSIL